MRKGWIATQYWLPITADKHTFLDFSQIYAGVKYEPYFTPAFERQLTDAGDSYAHIFVGGGETNYWHFMMDFMPRLIFLKLVPEIHGYSILLDDALSDLQRGIIDRILYTIGVRSPSYATVPRGKVISVRDTLVPGRIDRVSAVTIWNQHFCPNVVRAGPERIFVVRENIARRRLVNQNDIGERLRRLGFVSVDPGNRSFDEQIEMFSNARIVVGVHGAALTNLLFSPNGGHFVELRSGPPQPFLRDLALAKGFRHLAIDGIGTGTHLGHHDDFVIDADLLMTKLDPILCADA